MLGNPLLLGDDGYQISRSVRIRSSASASFSRTPAAAGNRRTWTWSGWVKRGALGSIQTFFSSISSAGVSTEFDLYFATNNTLQIGYGSANWRETNAVYRDTSAWYHIVLAVDTTQASDSNRILLYVNGVSQTFAVSNAVTQNTDTAVNMTYTHRIGGAPSYFGDMYMADINFIDGQALTPAAFGETDAITGVWKPKRYTGTYGTNGFFLNFSDPSAATAAAIGADRSGNGNNWTPNNISVTAGATYDSMLDVPTPWGDRGNYAVMNPLAVTAANSTITNGNLQVVTPNVGGNAFATMGIPASGKWYFEVTPTSGTNNAYIGVSAYTIASSYLWQNSNHVFYIGGGSRSVDGSSSAYGASYTDNDVIGVACDSDASTITFYKNNVSQGSISHTMVDMFPALTDGASASGVTYQTNFGQRPFAYTPPTGFRALNTQNLPEPTILKGNQFFDTLLWTSTATVKDITGSSFQPDLVWVKSRASASANEGFHHLVDAVRGAGKVLSSNSTEAEYWTGTNNSVQAFLPNGFTAGDADGLNGNAMVSWLWKEGATQGFDIVTYTGNGTAGRTISHSLGVAPAMMIMKSRSNARTWPVYHKNMTSAAYYIGLETTNQQLVDNTMFNSTAPTSSVFTVGTYQNANAENYVAYLFSEVAGFSRFGSYTGNGSADGPFVFTGFRPRWVMIKRTDAASVNGWYVWDTARNPANTANLRLYPNSSSAEVTGNTNEVDVLSGGFKLRFDGSDFNANGGTYIFAAFAENPFKYSLAR